MADSGDGEFPLWKFHQNYPLFTDDILNFMAQIKPTAAELMAKSPAADQSLLPPTSTSGEATSAADVDYWNSTVGPSDSSNYYFFPGETSRWECQEQQNFQIPGYYYGDGGDDDRGVYNMQLPIAPESNTFQPITCSCCLVLREIIHTNGINTRKLEIHGRFGILWHAILEENFPILGGTNSSSFTQYKMFDLSKKSTEEVKRFMMQHYLNQMVEEYSALPEPLSDFYDILCIGLDWNDDDAPLVSHPQPLSSYPVKQSDSVFPFLFFKSQSEQRQRAGRMTVNDLKEYLHLPISEAAKKMNLCLTVVKKICRRSGLRRWPYRKVKSYQRKMGALGTRLRSRDAETRARAEAEMERLRQELAQFCAGIVPD
ncbi:protein RKD2-like isoform X1 [Cucumis melo var. makuwa]|uniref:Protein RKD2-like isoform X1 n=1 Tax=Cucumis melo var. makuwa TaxID=1194695 RepID=A0A5A7VF79_CUCMM|nr:protein RKD2-like isoform X1 [Cucumis melo var. makuwa]